MTGTARERLEALATGGEWRHVPADWEFHDHLENAAGEHVGLSSEDIALIAETHNALPALLDRMARLEAVAAAAREARDWGGVPGHLTLDRALRALDEADQ